MVTAGQASIASSGSKLNVTQSSDKAVIDWRGFNIAPGEWTEFHQPSASSLTLNRVNSTSASSIDGKLTANGNIVIINQNGVLFGNNAKVDVNGLIATTADIDNSKFMNSTGKIVFEKPGNPDGSITNNGTITAKDAGLVGLVAPNVINNGVITAKLGKIHLASGDTMTVDLYGDSLMEIAVSDKVKSQLVANTGLLKADGGKVAMTAAAARDVVNSLVANSGLIQADSVADVNGTIILYAQGSNSVKNNVATSKGMKQGTSFAVNSGILDASGYGTGQSGGTISVLGDDVGLLSGSLLDASGDNSGGNINIGGEFHGAGTTPTAFNTYVDSNALVLANSNTKGNGGNVAVWSDNQTWYLGNIMAEGGKSGGNGGFVETSGHGQLTAGGTVDLLALNGKKGTYLLDPTNITIYGNVAPTFQSTDGTINLSTNLKLWLDASDQTTLFSDTAGTTQITNGGSVARWNDKSGNGNFVTQSTAANMPTWLSNSQNGLGVLSFDGTNDSLGSVIAGSWPTNGQFTVDSVVKFNSLHAADDSVIFEVGNGAFDSIYFAGALSGNQRIHLSDFNGSVGGLYNNAGTNNKAPSNTSIVVGSWNGSTWEMTENGTSLATNTATHSNTGYSTLSIGGLIGGGTRYTNGIIPEILLFNTALSTNATALVTQYQSAKWGIALTGPGNATGETGLTGAEAQSAMASIQAGATMDGYSVFTTAYLSRLSQTSNIILQASNNVSLDLKGDTLSLASGKSITLTAGNQITTASTGTITTSNGAINLNATNGIVFSNAFTVNSGGGNINLNNAVALGAALAVNSSGGAVNFANTVNGANNLTVTSGAGTTTFSSTIGATTPLNNLSLTVDALTFGGNIKGTGTLTIAPSTASTAMHINDGTSTGLYLTNTEQGYIQNGWASLVFGNSADSGVMTIGTSTWSSPVTFINGSNKIEFSGAQTLGANSLTAVTASGNIVLDQNAKIASTANSGNSIILASGGNILNNDTNDGSSALSPGTGPARWIVYSTQFSADTNGASQLSPSQNIYSQTYGSEAPGSVPGTNNTWVYSSASYGTITVIADAQSLIYGNNVPTLTYTCSGGGCGGITGTLTTAHGGAGTAATHADGFDVGTYAITPGSLASGGYVISYTGANLTLTTRPITVTASANTKTYDGTTSAAALGTITAGSLGTGDTATWTEVYSNKNFGVGNKTLTASADVVNDGNSGNNYNVTFVDFTTATINKAPITVTAATNTKTYDGTTSAAAMGTITSGSLGTGDTAIWTEVYSNKNFGVGNKTLTASADVVNDGNSGNNYTYTFVDSTAGTINKAPITVTASTNTKTYDGTTSAAALGTITTGTLGTGDTATWTEVYTDRNAGTGNKTLTASADVVNDGNSGNNYNVTFVDFTTGTINKAPITVTASANTKTYDGTTSAAALGTITTGSLGTGDTATWTEVYTNKNFGIGNKTLTASADVVNDGNSGNNYNVTFVDFTTGTINKAPITVTASTNTKTYDGTTSAAALGTITAGSLGTGDTATWTEVYTNRNFGVGNKTLTASADVVNDGNSGNNYTYTFVDNTAGTINKAAITVTAATNTKTYDGTTSAAALGTITSGSLGTGDTATWTEFYSNKNFGVGNKTLTASSDVVNDGNSGNNYTYTFVDNTGGTINKAPITVTASTNTKTYDGTTSAAALGTITAGSLGTGDTATWTEVYTNKNFGVGNKTLTASADVVNDGNSGNNYNVTFVDFTTGTINKAHLTVTADGGKTMVYGANSLPTLTSTITGYVNSEDATSAGITGTPTLATTATPYNGMAGSGSNAGTYDITANANTLAAVNYDFTYVNAINGLTVTPAVLTATADNQSRAFGVANPTFTETVTGFVNGDTSAILTGSATGSSATDSTTAGGTYPITGSVGTLGTTNNNYTFSQADGVLTINDPSGGGGGGHGSGSSGSSSGSSTGGSIGGGSSGSSGGGSGGGSNTGLTTIRIPDSVLRSFVASSLWLPANITLNSTSYGNITSFASSNTNDTTTSASSSAKSNSANLGYTSKTFSQFTNHKYHYLQIDPALIKQFNLDAQSESIQF